MLNGRRLLLGVTGSIAAYQAVDLVGLLRAEMADPATAHTLAKLANGLAGDALSATALAFRGPVVVAPAMNEGMWTHPAVVENVERLRRRGVRFVDPEYGSMACGGEGWGRLARLDRIVAEASRALEAPARPVPAPAEAGEEARKVPAAAEPASSGR